MIRAIIKVLQSLVAVVIKYIETSTMENCHA